MNAGRDQDRELRLSPEIASRRLLVLKFVLEYLDQWGESPSLGEIAAGLRISRMAAMRAVNALVKRRLLLRRGRRRGLMRPGQREEAVRVLREHGYVVDEDVMTVTKAILPRRVLLDYPPALDQRGGRADSDGGQGNEAA